MMPVQPCLSNISWCADLFFWKFPTKFDVFNIFRCRISDCWGYQALPKGALSYMITDTAPHSNGGLEIKEALINAFPEFNGLTKLDSFKGVSELWYDSTF